MNKDAAIIVLSGAASSWARHLEASEDASIHTLEVLDIDKAIDVLSGKVTIDAAQEMELLPEKAGTPKDAWKPKYIPTSSDAFWQLPNIDARLDDLERQIIEGLKIPTSPKASNTQRNHRGVEIHNLCERMKSQGCDPQQERRLHHLICDMLEGFFQLQVNRQTMEVERDN